MQRASGGGGALPPSIRCRRLQVFRCTAVLKITLAKTDVRIDGHLVTAHCGFETVRADQGTTFARCVVEMIAVWLPLRSNFAVMVLGTPAFFSVVKRLARH